MMGLPNYLVIMTYEIIAPIRNDWLLRREIIDPVSNIGYSLC